MQKYLPMKLDIFQQETYSRAELLLRSIFGFIYIVIPHAFLLFFLSIWGAILSFLTFWVILFTGRFPESWFEYQLKLRRWTFRLNARLYNLADGYPAFGLDAEDENTVYEVPYLENPDKISVLLRGIFGFIYVLIPHGFVLMFLSFAALFIMFISWWAILFTGKYPDSLFVFMKNFMKYNERVGLYLAFMVEEYPPFSLSAPGYEEKVAERAGMEYDHDSDNQGETIVKDSDLV
jgi:hypothetical protein